MEDEVQTGVDDVSAAETQLETNETGVETTPAAGEKELRAEKAFATKLAAEKAKWEASVSEKYKDYDTMKEIASWAQEKTGSDALSLKEQIEMERLQARAEQNNVPPEVMKRLDELEAKAAKAAEYEQQSQAQQAYSQFRQGLEVFAKENGAEPDAIQEFMVNNQIGNMEVAYKAMQYEAMKQQLETAKKEGVKEFLAAKGSIPNIPGNSALGQVQSPAPKTMEEARQRALQRLQ
jgi:hypothetical protein